MQGKKRSKIGHLASIFNAADADFNQKYRRNAFRLHSLRPSEMLKHKKRALSQAPFVTAVKI